jgi:hypothetical protein
MKNKKKVQVNKEKDNFFKDSFSLCSPGWPGTCDAPTSAS